MNENTNSNNLYSQAHLQVLHPLKICWLWQKISKESKTENAFPAFSLYE